MENNDKVGFLYKADVVMLVGSILIGAITSVFVTIGLTAILSFIRQVEYYNPNSTGIWNKILRPFLGDLVDDDE